MTDRNPSETVKRNRLNKWFWLGVALVLVGTLFLVASPAPHAGDVFGIVVGLIIAITEYRSPQ